MRMDRLAQTILEALPQTQCTRCGYPDCAAYADALANDAAGINQCPPGGAEGIERLARITGRAPLALNPANGIEAPRSVAIIDENWCIGCTLCLPVCPTDAIVGSNKLMHTVIEPHCTGCELCLPVCPVDCIRMESVSGARSGWDAWSASQAQAAGERFALHQLRRARDETEQDQRYKNKALLNLADVQAHSRITDPAEPDRKRSVIQAALDRARAKRTTAPR